MAVKISHARNVIKTWNNKEKQLLQCTSSLNVKERIDGVTKYINIKKMHRNNCP